MLRSSDMLNVLLHLQQRQAAGLRVTSLVYEGNGVTCVVIHERKQPHRIGRCAHRDSHSQNADVVVQRQMCLEESAMHASRQILVFGRKLACRCPLIADQTDRKASGFAAITSMRNRIAPSLFQQ